MYFNRRWFLQMTGGLTLATVSNSSIIATNSPLIELRARNAQGEPLDKEIIEQLYFQDLQDEPLPSPPRRAETGKLLSELPSNPFAIALQMLVEGFGIVTLYADNEGKGYRVGDFPLNLNLAFARSRLYRVRKAIAIWQRLGTEFPPGLFTQLEEAQGYLNAAQTTQNPALKARQCNQSLAASLWAGEAAVFTKAQQDIKNNGPRPNFLFGCNFFGHSRHGAQYDHYFQQIFNFATVPFYWNEFEQKPGEKDFPRTDVMVDWLLQANITPKGHPLVWLLDSVMPEWTGSKSYAEMQQLISQHVTEITSHYGSKIPYYDIINEVHKSASLKVRGYSFEQFLELTRTAAIASSIGYPKITRIINECCLWGENIAYKLPPQYSPYQFFQACLKAEIPFEVIGLQLYYSDRDMFEINRLLERFSQLGKPIHITELGVSSSVEVDENSYFNSPSGLWHEPWSETIQADWIEQFYTLCYSKSYIQAITWWDFADGGNFWPNGGLLKRDLTPKQSFYRLSRLIKQWRSKH